MLDRRKNLWSLELGVGKVTGGDTVISGTARQAPGLAIEASLVGGLTNRIGKRHSAALLPCVRKLPRM